MRINNRDDASGLAVSEKVDLDLASDRLKGILRMVCLVQTTEGYLEEITNIIQRMRVLAVQSNGIYSDNDRQLIR